MQKLVGGEGEMDVARAAVNLGLNMTLSSQSTTSLEDVITARPKGTSCPDFWFQIYLNSDINKSLPLLRRAEGMSDHGTLPFQPPSNPNHRNKKN